MLNNSLLIIFHFFTKLFCVEKQVSQSLYGDKNTRIFTFWTVRVLIFDFPTSTSHVYICCFLFEKRLFFFSWLQADAYTKTGCFNLMCPGFVQVSHQIAMGATISPLSIYNGPQYTVNFYVRRVVQYFILITLLNTSDFCIDIYDHIICTFLFSRKNSL